MCIRDRDKWYHSNKYYKKNSFLNNFLDAMQAFSRSWRNISNYKWQLTQPKQINKIIIILKTVNGRPTEDDTRNCSRNVWFFKRSPNFNFTEINKLTEINIQEIDVSGLSRKTFTLVYMKSNAGIAQENILFFTCCIETYRSGPSTFLRFESILLKAFCW